MNEADSERIAASLEKKGYQKTLKMAKADLIVVNMCSVRQTAVDRVYGLTNKFKSLRAKTILTGCILKKDRKKLGEGFGQILDKEDFFDLKPLRQDKLQAFIPISNGCNNFCSYCVVPKTRGKLICRKHQDILKETKEAIKNGAKEVWLLGQNANDYLSPTDKSINFAKLFKKINDLKGAFQIWFMSPHPENFTNELIEVLSQSPKFSKYLHLPVQSGDNFILKKMNRHYTVKQFEDLVGKIRKAIPQVNLSTDVIVGFPGETKKRFENTVKLFKATKFNMAYVAKYSQRPETLAFKFPDDVTWPEKKRRVQVLLKLLYPKKSCPKKNSRQK
jgi:tRNA-2-methylthio-N6-dimethylallyladenosine synthase